MPTLMYTLAALAFYLVPVLVIFGRLKAIEREAVEAREIAAEQLKLLRVQADHLSQIETAVKVANERR